MMTLKRNSLTNLIMKSDRLILVILIFVLIINIGTYTTYPYYYDEARVLV